MLEIAGTRMERGIFNLTLEAPLPKAIAWILRWGPIRGRLVALTLMLLGAFLGEGRLRFVEGYPLVVSKYLLFGLGAVVYTVIFLFRQERLYLELDKSKQSLRFLHQPSFAKKGQREGLVPYRNLQKLQVFGPDKEPRTPYGYMEIHCAAPEKDPYRVLRFAFLSEEQFKIYPWNLSKLTGLDPTGDYSDPHPDLPSL